MKLADYLGMSTAPATKYVTLEAGVAQTVTVYRRGAHFVAVCLFRGDAEIFFRTDGIAATELGDGCEGIPAALGQEISVLTKDTDGEISVSVIASDAAVVLVRAVA